MASAAQQSKQHCQRSDSVTGSDSDPDEQLNVDSDDPYIDIRESDRTLQERVSLDAIVIVHTRASSVMEQAGRLTLSYVSAWMRANCKAIQSCHAPTLHHATSRILQSDNAYLRLIAVDIRLTRSTSTMIGH